MSVKGENADVSMSIFFFFWVKFHKCLWFACSTFYCKCVMQRGTQAGLGLGLVLIHSGLDLFSV